MVGTVRDPIAAARIAAAASPIRRSSGGSPSRCFSQSGIGQSGYSDGWP